MASVTKKGKSTSSGFYAVANGRTKGIFYSWTEAERSVRGHPNAKFRKFANMEDAQRYVQDPSSIAAMAVTKRSRFVLRAPAMATLVYTDGSVRPGREGIGIYVIPPTHRDRRYAISYNRSPSTNQHAELRAIEWALANVQERPVHILTDSMYSYHILTKWMYGWAAGGWSMPNKNRAVIQRLYDMVVRDRNITFQHVGAHCGIFGNEVADKLANAALNRSK